MSKERKPFLSSKTIAIQLSPVFITLAAIVAVLLMAEGDSDSKISLIVLIGIFGGLISISSLIKAGQSCANLRYLKNNGYYEQMRLETPEKIHNLYGVTPTFVFGKDRKICLPIAHISAVQPSVVRYTNSAAKSKVQLKVYMDDGSDYYLIHKTGAVTEARKEALENCVAELVMRNPQIAIK